jgi:hypothetical protein
MGPLPSIIVVVVVVVVDLAVRKLEKTNHKSCDLLKYMT